MARKSPAQEAVALQIEFSPIGRTRVQVTFDEPELSSDGGALLLHQAGSPGLAGEERRALRGLGWPPMRSLRREVEPLLARAANGILSSRRRLEERAAARAEAGRAE